MQARIRAILVSLRAGGYSRSWVKGSSDADRRTESRRGRHPRPEGQADAWRINGLVEAGQKRIVLNLGEVPYIDSAGLGEVVRSYTTVKKHDGVLKLLSLTKRIQDLLAITKLLTVFDTYDSETDAVMSFGA
ncbi:MAG: rsbV [Acidobacteria bacterium]|nr:rsbV [Acidobacteriota bacterium]